MKKLKIAQVIPYRLSTPGGVKEHVLALASEFRGLGHQVVIIAPGETEPPAIEGLVTFGRGVPIFTLNGTRSLISFYNEAVWESLGDFFDRENFDVVHIHSPESPFLNWQILYAAKTAIVATFHTDFDWGILSELAQKSFLKAIIIFLETKIDGSIAVSRTAQKFARGCFRPGDRIIPNGVDLQRFHPAARSRLKKSRVKILFVGRIEKRKGLPYLIEALSLLPAGLPAELEVVGDGPDRGEAETLVSKLNLWGKVSFLGRVSSEEIPRRYREADLFCSPAIGGESQGVVLLEAMASGLPLVVFANPGYRELLARCPEPKCLVKPRDVQGLARALTMLIQNPTLRTALGEWGQQKAADFNWSSIAAEIISFYEVVIARHQSRKRAEYREFRERILIPLNQRFSKLVNGTREVIEKNFLPLRFPE